MAVQIETQGQLSEFLEILSRRRWQLVLPALLVLTLGISVAVFIPKKYLVSTQVEVRPVSVSVSGKEVENAPNQIRAIERIRKVLEQLKNPEYMALDRREQNEFVSDVRDDLKVRPDRPPGATSAFVTIEYTNVNVKRAMEFLKALRDDWKKDVIDRDKNKVDGERTNLENEVAALEKASKQEEDELTRLYQRNKISATQPIPGGKDQRTEDPDFDRLQKAKDLLSKVVLDLARSEGLVASLEKQLAETPPKLSEEQVLEGVNNSADLLALQKSIEDQYSELDRYKPAHPKYGQILKKIEELEGRRDAIKKLATRTELASVAKPNPRYTDLQTQFALATRERDFNAAAKEQLERDINEGTQNVEQLYLVYNEIRQRSTRAELLAERLKALTLKRDEKLIQARDLASRLNDPFSITQEVQEPLKPTEPNPWLIIAFALVAGLSLGLAIALSAEYGRNCFRSVHDISRVMVAPVLGSIGRIETSRQRRARALRRALVGSTCALLIAGVGFVTWAWARNPELLSPQLRSRIEQIRHKLR